MEMWGDAEVNNDIYFFATCNIVLAGRLILRALSFCLDSPPRYSCSFSIALSWPSHFGGVGGLFSQALGFIIEFSIRNY